MLKRFNLRLALHAARGEAFHEKVMIASAEAGGRAHRARRDHADLFITFQPRRNLHSDHRRSHRANLLAESSIAVHLSAVLSRSLLFLLALVAACNSASLKDAPETSDDTGAVAKTDSGKKSSGRKSDGGTVGVGPESLGLSFTKDVKVYVQPGNANAVLDSIKKATKSIHVTMYLLTDNDIEDALVEASKTKEVKVVLNGVFPEGGNANTSAYNKLKAAKVPVVWSSTTYAYTHSKCVIIDGSAAWIMTMNLTESSAATNREFLAYDTDASDVAIAEEVFQADFSGEGVVVGGKLLVSPPTTSERDSRTTLISFIQSAQSTIDMEAETLSDDKIVAELIAAHEAGVTVRIVLDSSSGPGSTAQQKAVKLIKDAGISIKTLRNPDVHAKAIVIDDTAMYIGSMNFTYNSLVNNREIGLLSDTPSEVSLVAGTIEKDFSTGKAY